MAHIGIMDVSGIQPYLFRTPLLREIAQRSASLEAMARRPDGLFAGAFAEAGANPLALAGGIASATADGPEALREAFGVISRAMIESGSGLDAAAVVAPYEAGRLAEGYSSAVQLLERRKLTAPRSVAASFPGLDAPAPTTVETPAGAGAQAMGNGWEMPAELDRMILEGFRTRPDGAEEPERAGLMAVVCVDGLGMGSRVIRWLTDAEAMDDESFRAEFSGWSEAVKRRWARAWDGAIEALAQRFDADDGALRHLHTRERSLRPRTAAGRRQLPCRRIYQGGDDLTFVCDARIALGLTADLAARLEQPAEEKTPELFRSLTVSAGVLFVDAHYPFGRAVALAEEVRVRAKRRATAEAGSSTPPSCIDWWVNREGALHCTERKGSCKPYRLRTDPGAEADVGWDLLESRVLAGLWNVLGGARNKLKDLAVAVETGPASVTELVKKRPLPGAGLAACVPDGFDRATGFAADRTPLIDAVELFDIHFPLAEEVPE